MMKEKLIILSDLWGFKASSWPTIYIDFLSQHFEIELWDACDLAGLKDREATQEERHQFFLEGGLENAVAYCLKNITSPIKVLAYSIGGTIAWQASLRACPINKLYAVSATRLRYETQALSFPVKLIYGELDTYRPDPLWLQFAKVEYTIIPNATHEMYTQNKFQAFLQRDQLGFFKD